MVLIEDYFQLAKQYLSPLEEAYRGREIFPIREDESVFISLAAFREHLLGQTLKSAFGRYWLYHSIMLRVPACVADSKNSLLKIKPIIQTSYS